MNRHCIPGLTMSSPDGKLSLVECPGIIKTMHWLGFSVYIALYYANAPVRWAREETGRYDLAWKDFV